MGVSLVVLGAGLQFVSIVLRGVAAQRWPLGNMYEFISAITFAAVVTWLVVLKRGNGLRPLGAFVLFPVVVLQFLGGTVLYTQAAPVMPALQSYWLVVHVTTVSIASGLFFVPGIASILFLLRSSDRLPAALAAKVPSAEALDRLAYRVTIIAFPLYTFAVIAGAIWAEAAWGRFWGWDPKETVAFVAWVIYASYLHARATAGWRSGRAAWVNVAGPGGGGLQPVLHQPRGRGPPLVRRGELRGRTRPRLDHRVVTPLPSASEEGLGGFVWGLAGWTNDGA